MVSIGVRDLSVYLVDKDRGRTILDNVDFYAAPGTLTAIMGPSGSGKTTFLNVLAGRFKYEIEASASDFEWNEHRSRVTGSVLINGHPVITRDSLRQSSRYVMQHDDLPSYLTVEEVIWKHAHLVLRAMTVSAKREKVEDIIIKLGLDSCRHNLVGGENCKGISGGQKKRVSVAIELLADPSLIYLDEPTSGLDAALAFDVVKVLKRLTKSGRTVVATIHQPRPEIYSLFDRLMLLSDGMVAYHGPATDITAYLTSVGHPPPTHYALSDFLLDILTPSTSADVSGGVLLKHGRAHSRASSGRSSRNLEFLSSIGPMVVTSETLYPQHDQQDELQDRAFAIAGASCDGRTALSRSQIHHLTLSYLRSRYHKDCLEAINVVMKCPEELPANFAGSHTEFLRWYWLTVQVLCGCYWKKRKREPSDTWNLVACSLWMAVCAGLIWWQKHTIAYDVESMSYDCISMNNFKGALAWHIIDCHWRPFAAAISLPSEKKYRNREVAGGLYKMSASFLAAMATEVPFVLIPPVVHAALTIAMTGLPMYTIKNVFHLFATYAMTALCASGLVNFLASMSPTITVCVNVAAPVMFAYSLTSGFWIAIDSLPIIWRIFGYSNWLHYGYDAIQLAIFNEEQIAQCSSVVQWLTPWSSVGLMIGLASFWRILAYIGLRYTNRNVGLS